MLASITVGVLSVLFTTGLAAWPLSHASERLASGATGARELPLQVCRAAAAETVRGVAQNEGAPEDGLLAVVQERARVVAPAEQGLAEQGTAGGSGSGSSEGPVPVGHLRLARESDMSFGPEELWGVVPIGTALALLFVRAPTRDGSEQKAASIEVVAADNLQQRADGRYWIRTLAFKEHYQTEAAMITVVVGSDPEAAGPEGEIAGEHRARRMMREAVTRLF